MMTCNEIRIHEANKHIKEMVGLDKLCQIEIELNNALDAGLEPDKTAGFMFGQLYLWSPGFWTDDSGFFDVEAMISDIDEVITRYRK